MTRVRWTDNTCTVGDTCIHGYFTATDLKALLDLCPSGLITPTFYDEKIPLGASAADIIHRLTFPNPTVYERGFYFSFREADGQRLLEYLKTIYPMVRGEPGN